jgi:hypothetical protein
MSAGGQTPATVNWTVFVGNNEADTGIAVNTNQWSHIAVVYSGSDTQFYLNGVLRWSRGSASTGYNGSAQMKIGRSDFGSGSSYFPGLIDDVRVYNRALNADEIKRLYNLGGTVKLNTSQNLNNNNSLQNGLVGWWTFDGNDISGVQAYDRSGNGNRGILTSGPVQAIGKIGQGLSFDGGDDYVDSGSQSSLDLSVLTAAFWVKAPKQINSSSRLLDKLNQNVAGWNVQTNGDGPGIQLRIDTSAGVNQLPVAINGVLNNTWHHVAIVISGGIAAGYLDGVVSNSGTYSQGTGLSAAVNLLIGARNGSSSSRFNGLMDDVRIYNRVLSKDEIKRLYNIGGTVKLNTSSANNSLSQGLVGWWTFDGKDMAGNYAFDKSGNGNRGTLTGTNGMPVRTIGKIGQGLSFDGVDDYVNVGSSPTSNLSAFSVSAWFKTSARSNNDFHIISKADAGNYFWALAIDNPNGNIFAPTWQCDGANHSSLGSPITGLTDGRWHHVLMVVNDNVKVEIFVDGQSSGSTEAFIGSLCTGSTANVNIGRRTDNQFYFNDTIDDVRIYNRALSLDEIKRLYNVGR